MFRIFLLLLVLCTAFSQQLQKHAPNYVTFLSERGFKKRSVDARSKLPETKFEFDNTPNDVIRQFLESDEKHTYPDGKTASSGFVSVNIEPYVPRHHEEKSERGDKPSKNQNSKTYSEKSTESRRSSKYSRYKYKRRQQLITKRIYAPIHNMGKTAVSKVDMRTYPYINIVQLSTGCLGTLLTPYHVLTAAHCVHDGERFKDNIEMLKIKIPDKIGYRIHYIVKISVPVMWMRTQTLPEVGRGAYDYAVLNLNLPVGGRNHFMQLTLPNVKVLNSDVHFLGFFPDLSRTLMKSTCSSDDSHVIMGKNVLLRECDTAAGNSGAAVFSENAIDGDKLIGVLSNSITTPPNQYSTEYNKRESIMLLTLPKCLEICTMIYPQTQWHDVCNTIRKYNVEYLQAGFNRIMPFFG